MILDIDLSFPRRWESIDHLWIPAFVDAVRLFMLSTKATKSLENQVN